MQKVDKGVALIIHAKSSASRKNNVENLIKTLNNINITKNLKKIKIEAIDGSFYDPKSKELESFQKNIYKPYFFSDVSVYEIACFLSHKKAWQYIIDNNFEYGLILEDDASIDSDLFRNSFKLGYNSLKDNYLIRFHTTSLKFWRKIFARYKNELYIPYIPRLGAVCYMINQNTAKKLQKLSTQFDRPVDTFMQFIKTKGVFSFEIMPSGIYEISYKLGGSTINKNNKLSFYKKLITEYLRIIYRLQIWIRGIIQ
jgi:GR25 family glycosyltransferase involved in LPS biosynthesis